MYCNAESNDSPLRKVYTHIHYEKVRPNGKKYYPDKKYGNNKESPNYMQISKIYNNSFIKNNIYYKDEITDKIKKNSHIRLQLPVLVEGLGRFVSKPNIKLGKALNKAQNYDDNIDYTVTDNKNIPIVYPKITNKESSYLKNINEFNIRESYGVDQSRIIKFNTKPLEDYNCVADRKLSMAPVDVKIEKWPVFYEK